MAHSPHRRCRGCQLCKPHKFKDNGQAVRTPAAVLRQLGKSRRLSRNFVPEDNDCGLS